MADKNIVMHNVDYIRSLGVFSEHQIQAAIVSDDGVVGDYNDPEVGLTKVVIAKRATAVLPPQQGEY